MEENNINRLKVRLKNRNKSKIMKFGISFAIGMFLLSVILFLKGTNYWILTIPLFLFIYHLIFSIVNTNLVYPSFVALSFLGKIVGNTMSSIVFIVVFYVFITPISVILRLSGKDHIKTNCKCTSWMIIEEEYNDPKRIEKLF